MKWTKLGSVHAAGQGAVMPTPLLRPDGTVRVFIGCTDENDCSRIGYVDVAADDPTNVLRVSETPVLERGRPGCFDDSGVRPSSLVQEDGILYLYYVGVQLSTRVRSLTFSGRAESRDGGDTFVRTHIVPVLERGDGERVARAEPFVRRDDDGVWRAWYVSSDSQDADVRLRHVESRDGVRFDGRGREVLPLDRDETAFARPVVVSSDDAGVHRMFFSVRTRSNGDRLGYAESSDGIDWRRMDDRLALDSEGMSRPSHLQVGDRHYLFYDENQFGRGGFGVARLEQW